MGSLWLFVLFMFLFELYQANGQSVVQLGDGGRRGNDRDDGRNNRGGRQWCREGERAVGYCSWSGRCTISNAYCRNQLCCSPTGVYVTTTSRPISAFCSTGQREIGPCINGICPSGSICTNGRCCTSNVGTRCPTGLSELGPCVNGMCQSGATCTNGRCCAFNVGTRCPTGQNELGPCINGGCQTGATCTNGRCCAPNVGSGLCPGGTDAVGPCVNNMCPTPATCINNSMCCMVSG